VVGWCGESLVVVAFHSRVVVEIAGARSGQRTLS
jgi:hypothetical protein